MLQLFRSTFINICSALQSDALPYIGPCYEIPEKYTELHLLGKGGYGSVFAGHREVDKLPVGVFGILKMRLCEVISNSSSNTTVSLLDWYELEEELLIVMERPTPSQDLNDYLDENGAGGSSDSTSGCKHLPQRY
uniref:non-specific serine/threonine protein kinase n=1 Tax=Xiphophorus couchianus TaxID=32473 RepID=A0A3B5KRX6_9TELE